MVLLYIDHERLNVSPQAAECLRIKTTEGGISCGSTVVGVSRDDAARGCLYWKFNGCPTIEVNFPRGEMESVRGAERIAAEFVEKWHRQFAISPERCERCNDAG